MIISIRIFRTIVITSPKHRAVMKYQHFNEEFSVRMVRIQKLYLPRNEAKIFSTCGASSLFKMIARKVIENNPIKIALSNRKGKEY